MMLGRDLLSLDASDYGGVLQSENNLENVIAESQGISSVLNQNQGSDTSDYRGVPKSTSQSKEINSQNTTTVTAKKTSFSNVLKASAFPKKDQAIIYPVIEGIPVKDYVIGTGDIVGPQNVLYASRMSNNRVCIYLSSKELVNQFVNTNGGITINDIFIPVRKLILPAKRIILSNVSPCIPHYVLEDELKEKHLKLVSPVSNIGFGLERQEYRHVRSFRRQVFIAIDQIVEIPSSIVVNFDDEDYRIFISDDKVRCFKCKEEGHIASNCVNTVEPINVQITNKRPIASTLDGCSLEVDNNSENMEVETVVVHEDSPNENHNTIMDVVSSHTENSVTVHSLIGNPNTTNDNSDYEDVTAPRNKKLKPSDSFEEIQQLSKQYEIRRTDSASVSAAADPNMSEELQQLASHSRKQDTNPVPVTEDRFEEIQQLWLNNSDQILDFCNFVQFFKQVKGNNKPLEIARQYTKDIEGLIRLISSVKTVFSHRSHKERCRRLAASLKKALLSEGYTDISPPESLSSSQLSLNRSFSIDSDKSSY